MKKRSLLPGFLLVCFLQSMSAVDIAAQTVLTSECNGFRAGDSLLKIRIPYVVPDEAIVKSIKELPAETYIQKFYQKGDTMVCAEHGTLYYYKEKGDSRTLSGFENRTSRMDYAVPQLQQSYPFGVGDSATEYFHSTGCYGERLHLEVFGKSTFSAEKQCDIVCGTDTIKNCLRVHRRHEMVRNSSMEEFPETRPCNDSIMAWMNNHRDLLVEDHWLWYLAGWRYPILESIDTYHTEQGKRVDNFSTSFLYLPEWQDEDLAVDVENELARMRLRQELLDADSGDDDKIFPIHMTASLCGDGASLALSYEQTEDGTVKFIACDQAARTLASASYTQNAGHHQDTLHFQTVPSGNIVVLYMEINGMKTNVKISNAL